MKHILIVEDNKDFRRGLVMILGMSHKVDEAVSLEKALSLLQNNHYDVVLTDGNIPESGDKELTHIQEGDFRGNIVSAVAKAKGCFVIGISSEPGMHEHCDMTMPKNKIDIARLQTIIDAQGK